MTPERQFELRSRVEQDHWWFKSLRELVVEIVSVRVPPGGAVLDAGCGTGAVLAALPSSYERFGVDVESDALALAGRRTDAELTVAGVESMPFPVGRFDAVVSLDVISDAGVADDTQALRELRRVLRPGGTLVLNLPAYGWLRSGHDVVARTARRYTRRSVRDALRGVGFHPDLVSYRVTAVFSPVAIRRVLLRSRVETDVGEIHPLINRSLLAVARTENRLLQRFPLPFGLSVFAVARAEEDA